MRAGWLLFSCVPFFAAASGAACNGEIQPDAATDAGRDAKPEPVGRDSGLEPDADVPPPRAVTAPTDIDLGTFAPGAEATFVVKPNALGFNVVVETLAAGTTLVGIERITSPNGEIVHDAFTPTGGNHPTSDSEWGTIASASVPQGEAKSGNPPIPGTWKVRFGGSDDSGAPTMRASVRIQTGSAMGAGGFVGGRLDLRVFVPKGVKVDHAYLDADAAKTHAGIARRLDAFFGGLSEQVGIDRGDVTFHGVASALDFIDSEALLREGFATSVSRPNGEQALNLLITNGIDLGDGQAAWGIAPGIPGAHGHTGTTMSGIILAIDDAPAIGDGLTILHEAGHFFGLNHTTELSGGFSDPLADTPKCEKIAADDPFSLRDCPDKLNVMFPTFYGSTVSAVQVSDAQRRVMRGAPVYKAYASAIDGTMARTSPLSVEPYTLTKSGRALAPTEQWLAASLCGNRRLAPDALVKARGRDRAIAELRAAAVDADLLSAMRRNAEVALRRVE